MLSNAVKTIRNHWKKTIFFSGLTVYGIKYSVNLYREALLRVKYCEEARTEHEGQAKRFMEVLDDTDAIIIAGGNGLLGEVITGLLKRPDQERFSKIPIGIVPVGYRNTLAHCLYEKGESVVEWMAELGMSIIKGTTNTVDVMHLQSEDGKSVYAVNSLTWGAYEEAEERKSKYWFVGPLKHRFTYLMSTIGSWPPNKTGELSYGYSCNGCSRCYVSPPPVQWRWWHAAVPPAKKAIPEYASRDNPQCGVMHTQELNTIEFRATTCNDSHEAKEKKDLQIYLGPKSMSRNEFIKEGWSRLTNRGNPEHDHLIEASRFKLRPETGVSGQGREVMYSIDHEEFDAVPVEVTLLKNKLTVFCPLIP